MNYEKETKYNPSSDKKYYKCHKCNRKFEGRSILQTHKCGEPEARNCQFRCHICREVFKTLLARQKHFSAIHSTQRHQVKVPKQEEPQQNGRKRQPPRRNEPAQQPSTRKRYKCHICGKKMVYSRSVTRHLANVHGKVFPKLPENQGKSSFDVEFIDPTKICQRTIIYPSTSPFPQQMDDNDKLDSDFNNEEEEMSGTPAYLETPIYLRPLESDAEEVSPINEREATEDTLKPKEPIQTLSSNKDDLLQVNASRYFQELVDKVVALNQYSASMKILAKNLTNENEQLKKEVKKLKDEKTQLQEELERQNEKYKRFQKISTRLSKNWAIATSAVSANFQELRELQDDAK